MGRVRIACCGEIIYWNDKTKGGQMGTVRCTLCGCVYGWRDIGGGETRTWTEEPCPQHSFGVPQPRGRMVVCSYCKGYGYVWKGYRETCPVCKGSGYARA